MILVVGATGALGGTIARRLLEQGREVRILVRPGSDSEALVEAGAQAVEGDLKDRESLDPSVDGVETVITTANSARRGGVDNVANVDRQGNRNLIDAAKAAGVKHFIFISAMGAGPNSPVDFMRAKGESEEYLRESGIPYTILSPNLFMEVWVASVVGGPARNGRSVTLIGEADHRHTFVSQDDVAAFAVAAVDNPAAINQQIFIGGPEAVSWSDIVDRAGRVLGRSLPVQRVAPGDPVPGMPDHIAQMMASFETYETPLDMTETSRTYDVRLTPVDEYLLNALTASS